MTDRQTGYLADILIVDDTPANLRLLSHTLAEKGYGVRSVTSGPRALESAQTAPPNLILLDIRMPEMDGFEVCRQLKDDERTRDIPIIFISALDETEDKVRAFQVGGVDYITKPFRVEEVLARTETHLALRRLQTGLESANRRFARELALAATVQASFLPGVMPEISGWEFAARLQPARETSGDFYDIIRLPHGRLGLLIADVVDKGVPAALLMAMSWSLIWTYATQHPESPEAVFAAVNRSLTLHLGGHQFLTAFYGVLDPGSGRLVYANGGQPPPLFLDDRGRRLDRLVLTGPPLGVLEDASWRTEEIVLSEGDALILYTDGVTDARAAGGRLFGRGRLETTAREHAGKPARATRDGILRDVEAFVGGETQFDDIALLVVTRRSH